MGWAVYFSTNGPFLTPFSALCRGTFFRSGTAGVTRLTWRCEWARPAPLWDLLERPWMAKVSSWTKSIESTRIIHLFQICLLVASWCFVFSWLQILFDVYRFINYLLSKRYNNKGLLFSAPHLCCISKQVLEMFEAKYPDEPIELKVLVMRSDGNDMLGFCVSVFFGRIEDHLWK